jgi:UDP-glucuronate 4-epimerase
VAYLVTGAAGFIGSHVAQALLARGERVIGIDNLNAYYPVSLKEARLARLTDQPGFSFLRADISDRDAILGLAGDHPDIRAIIHLAAQAGVRHSLVDPYSYVQSNLMGQVVMLEAARRLPQLAHFVYASSSSVYGRNSKQPFSIDDPVDHPISLYAATKRADELIAESYAWIHKVPMTGLRFFTVYGPWGRPDMAAYLFALAIVEGKPIHVFNHGQSKRDFTYIDDIVAGVLAATDRPAAAVPGQSPHRVYNLGNHRPEKLMDFIGLIEKELGRTAEKIMEPLPPGDVPETYADIDASRRDLGFEPRTPLSEGIPRFIAWFKSYHQAN